MTKQNISFNLSVLIFQEDKTWIAQCLEWDVAAQGKTIDDALGSFERTFVGQIILDVEAGRNPLEGTSQAPREYWKMFDIAKKLEERKPFYFPEEIPAAYIIAAAAQDLRIAA